MGLAGPQFFAIPYFHDSIKNLRPAVKNQPADLFCHVPDIFKAVVEALRGCGRPVYPLGIEHLGDGILALAEYSHHFHGVFAKIPVGFRYRQSTLFDAPRQLYHSGFHVLAVSARERL